MRMIKKKSQEEFSKILEDIVSVKIQGAENIAKAGIKAYLINPTKKSAKKILKIRSTEPLLQNALKFIQNSADKETASKNFLEELEKSHSLAIKFGARLIKKDMNIYSHCHSSTVIDILKYAKLKNKKDFTVYTTEVEPLLQGRKTAKDLAKAKIKVIISPDLAAEQIIKKCDLFLFGADAYTKREVVNKIGTNTLSKLANTYKIPRYSCGVSLKFTKQVKIENRSSKEVWNIKSSKIEIKNPAFDKTSYNLLTGIISEFGILSPKDFVKLARKNLKRF